MIKTTTIKATTKRKLGVKTFLTAILMLACFAVLAGCSQGDAGNTKDEEQEPIKIGLLAIDDSLPFFVAEENGLFTEAGVQVELIPFSSARDKDTALEAGEIDGVMTDLVVTGLLKKGGLNVQVVSTALGATPAEGRFMLLAAPNSNITKIEEFKNQPIAIGNNTIIQFITDEALLMNGFQTGEINTQNIPDLKLRLEALLAGNGVSGAILPDPLASLAVLDGAKVILDDTALLDANQQPLNLSQSVIVFREDSINQKGAAIAKTLQAYDAAKTLINQDGQAYRDAMIRFAKVPQALTASYQMPTYTVNTVPTEAEVGRVMSWMQEKGLLDAAYSYEELVNQSFLNQ